MFGYQLLHNIKLRSLKLWFLGFLFLFLGCSQSSQSCSCAEPIPGGFPKSKVIKNIGQVKLTRHGFDFLENNSSLIIKQFMPNGLTFDVPHSKSSGVEVCLKPPCTVTGKIKKLSIKLIPKKTLRTNLILDLSSNKIKIRYKKSFFRITCDLVVTMKNKSITTDINVRIDPPTQYMTFDIGNPSFSIKNSDFKLSGGVGCSIINGIKGLFKGMIEKEVKKAVADAVKDLSCQKCKKTSDCPSGTTCSKDKCMRGNTCAPAPLGMEGQTDLSSIASGLGGKQMKKFMFSYFIGSTAEVKTTGLELGSLGGTHSEKSSCVPKKNFPPLPTPQVFTFPAKSPDGKSYMLGAAFSQVFFDSAARSMYLSGLLCLNIDKNLSPQLGSMLSAQGLGALVSPSILLLTKKAPMYIALRPAEVPDISIGAGTFTTDSKGKKIIKEPLLDLKIRRLGFDFFLFLYDRWIRLFTYRVDLSLPIGLSIKPNNKIGLTMGDMATALTNPSIENSYILKEDPKKMVGGLHNLFKSLLPMAVGQLGNQEFDLPDMQGFKIQVRGITGQIPRTDRPNRFKFLTLFADLGIASSGHPLLPKMLVELKYIKTTMPPKFFANLKARVKLTKFPSVTFDISNYDPEREYSVRLNTGMWSRYSSRSHYVLESPQFIIQGQHTIYIRSRIKNNHNAYDDATGWMTVHIDYTPPTIRISRSFKGITVTTKDNIAPLHTIDLQYSVNHGVWRSLTSGDLLSKLPHSAKIEIRSQDTSGNVQKLVFDWKQDQLPPIESSVSSTKTQLSPSGCQTIKNTPENTLFFFFFFVLLWLPLLRKRHQ